MGAIAAREQCECGCHYETDILNDCMKMEHCVLKRIFNAVKRHYSIEDSYWIKSIKLHFVEVCFN